MLFFRVPSFYNTGSDQFVNEVLRGDVNQGEEQLPVFPHPEMDGGKGEPTT